MKRAAAIIFLAALCGVGRTAQESGPALVARLEKNLASMDSFQSDFEHTRFSSTVAAPLRQRGVVYFRKPDSMRWEYTTLEKNVFVIKGGLFLSYFPEDNQLWRQRVPKEQYETELLAILAGKADLTRKFRIEDSPFPGGTPGAAQLKLTPEEEGDYKYLLLEIERAGAVLRRLILFDWADNKEDIAFSRFKPGARLSDDVFKIKTPPDCEIIDETGPVKR
jgi:outer membrane lipoprotein-sorting protein